MQDPLIAQDPTIQFHGSQQIVYPDPTGSVWVKTTASNLGFLADVSTYNPATVIFDPGSAPIYKRSNCSKI